MKELYESALRNIFLNPNAIYPYTHHVGSQKLAIIVDPRYDDLMLAVIRNFIYFMNPCGWNFMIVTHEMHQPRVNANLPGVGFMSLPNGLLDKDPVNGNTIPNMSIDSYNRILMDRDFWESLPAEHVLVFQTDCIMFRMFDEAWIRDYDYVGANWYSPHDMAFIEGGVNGGCSLRSRRATIDCLKYVSWDLLEQVRENQIKRHKIHGRSKKFIKYYEDVFYTSACELLHKRMPPISERSLFAIEADYDLRTCCYHGWNKNYQNMEQARALLSVLVHGLRYNTVNN